METITNYNCKNDASQDVYDAFNSFVFSTDIKIIGKLLYRYNFFNMTMHLPGDIVEIGVFKGSGVATFQKFIEIFCGRSNKKVLGFDVFNVDAANGILEKDSENDKKEMNKVFSRVDKSELDYDVVKKRLEDMNTSQTPVLIKGDVEDTLPVFLSENPGFRASLIYIDVDIERPTYIALKYLWNRLLPGGVVVFDEYEYHTFSESNGVDKFLKEFDIEYDVKSTLFTCPTAYIIKKK